MNNFNTNTYEIKREILKYAKSLSIGLSKSNMKFVYDMIYGIFASGSVFVSDISRSLMEETKLINTIERLCRNANTIDDKSLEIITRNHHEKIVKYIGVNPIVYIDDSDINKETASKFEDLAYVRDGSAKGNKVVKGYPVAEAVVVSEKMKQPISLSSHIYSTTSKGFISSNDVTLKTISEVKKVVKQKSVFVFDRG